MRRSRRTRSPCSIFISPMPAQEPIRSEKGARARERAKERLDREIPGLHIVGTSSPRVDVDASDAELERVLAPVKAARPDLIFVALGAPKQEIWSHRVREELRPAVLVGIGASLDFL